MILYCRRCVYPSNHPLGLELDAEGVCSGCRVHEEKDRLDWTARERKLAAIFDAYRDRSGLRRPGLPGPAHGPARGRACPRHLRSAVHRGR